MRRRVAGLQRTRTFFLNSNRMLEVFPGRSIPSVSRIMRQRTPILLIVAMAAAIIVVSLFTIKVLQLQTRALDDAIRESDAGAVALLANRTEQAILAAMRPPFLALKNIPIDALDKEHLSRLDQQYPQVARILLLDSNMNVRLGYSKDNLDVGYQHDAWLAERANIEVADKHTHDSLLIPFVEIIEGQPVLFGLQRVNDIDRSNGWVLIQYNLDEITSRYINPLISEFEQTHHGTARLRDSQTAWDDSALNWPVSKFLPGWLMVFDPDLAAGEQTGRDDRALMLAVATGVILALALATFTIWRELRREQALVDLRGRFVANVSHELKTPLALIRMYAETLYLNRVTDDKKRHQYYRVVLREAERLTQMINTVLDFSQLSQGLKSYQLNESDLHKTVSEIIESYRPRIEEQGMRVDADLHPSLPPVAHDPNAITQILLNLIDNSIKYAAAGGVIVVSLAATERHVELSVTDQGPGITTGERDRLRKAFERGQNVDAATGSGLGLAVVEQIAGLHHARFILKTPAAGKGLAAVIQFPVSRAKS